MTRAPKVGSATLADHRDPKWWVDRFRESAFLEGFPLELLHAKAHSMASGYGGPPMDKSAILLLRRAPEHLRRKLSHALVEIDRAHVPDAETMDWVRAHVPGFGGKEDELKKRLIADAIKLMEEYEQDPTLPGRRTKTPNEPPHPWKGIGGLLANDPNVLLKDLNPITRKPNEGDLSWIPPMPGEEE